VTIWRRDNERDNLGIAINHPENRKYDDYIAGDLTSGMNYLEFSENMT